MGESEISLNETITIDERLIERVFSGDGLRWRALPDLETG